jgi:endonuclease/exonuclease/phosphatase family metal-dependent hydrolase
VRAVRGLLDDGTMRRVILLFVCLAVAGCLASPSTEPAGAALDETWPPPAPREGNLRISTFNVRNFPAEGPPVEGEPSTPPLSYSVQTDQDELIDVLVAMGSDLVAVQEIRDPAAFDALLERLSEVTGRSFRAVWSVNLSGNEQHVGIVYDAARLAVDDLREHEEVDVSGTLRPGLSAHVASLRPEGGVDFRVMVLHLASGESSKRRALRVQQVTAVASLMAALAGETGEQDAVVLGDLNTAGGEEELPALDEAMATAGLARAVGPMACTAYYVKKATNPLLRPSLLDQVYLGSFAERDADVPLLAGAHCAIQSCERFESRDPETGGTFWGVSDHCPVSFEVRDEDRDGEEAAP